MISYLEGKLAEKGINSIVVDVKGIGYEVVMSEHSINSLPFENEMVKVLTYMQVREDGISLFGFNTKEEKKIFLKLISVSGIGPKVAMGILSNISINDLVLAIQREDIKMLCTVKGLGKKTVERLLVELKDQELPSITEIANDGLNQNFIDEATDALVSLGVGKNEAYRLAKENANENATVEEIITKALKGMNK